MIAAIGMLCVPYVRGHRRLQSRLRRPAMNRARAFAAAVATLFIALISPVAALGETIFTGHMVQHILLTMVVAPLLVVADVGTVALWAFGRTYRKRIGGAVLAVSPAWRFVTRPLVAWTVHVATLVFWHTPAAYQAAVESHSLHAIEHASFIATAIPFWWNLVAPLPRRRLHFGGAVIYLFGAALAGALMGAAITMARAPWYPVHGRGAFLWGLTALEDQRLAGLVMWVPAGIIYLMVLVPIALPALRQRPNPALS
jgi:putative membrane protein